MTDDSQSISDFLNDDDDDEFDVEKLAKEFEENNFAGLNDANPDDSNELYAETSELDSSDDLEDGYDESALLDNSREIPRRVRDVEDESFSVTPTGILEGMLFVGEPDNRSIPAEEMSALMRGVSSDEIDELVSQLNDSYRMSNSPFKIIADDEGYRMVLAKGYEFCRQRFYREEKAATLSQSVVDVLALVAYLQPVTKTQVEEKKLKPCGSILNQLVRRRLIEVDRKKVDGKSKVFYRTTQRFLDHFGIDSLDELPKSQAFDVPG